MLQAPVTELHRLDFTFDALLTFDCFKSERQVGPLGLMVYYSLSPSGSVRVASMWKKDKDGQWITTKLPRWQEILVENGIEDGHRVERERLAASMKETA